MPLGKGTISADKMRKLQENFDKIHLAIGGAVTQRSGPATSNPLAVLFDTKFGAVMASSGRLDHDKFSKLEAQTQESYHKAAAAAAEAFRHNKLASEAPADCVELADL